MSISDTVRRWYMYLFQRAESRYLLAGGFNTAFGYIVAVGLYYSLTRWLNLVVIVVLANVVCISVSFLTYKLYVFRTQGNWWREYGRCYVVYGGSALVGIAGLWVLVEVLGMAFWLAQALLLFVSVAFSFFGHSRFTFRKKDSND